MFRFPFYGYPYNYPYYRYYNKYNNTSNLYPESTPQVQAQENKSESKKDSVINSNEFNNTTSSKFSSNPEDAIFEIFGIKLYLDDLIILGILFFLYQQNVNDQMLYIILFLLLFS